MTKNQIAYFNAKETQRHNYVTEQETNRSNLAKEYETYRHNYATEVETNRHNVVGETETYRHNYVMEGLQMQANANQYAVGMAQAAATRYAADMNYKAQSQRTVLQNYQYYAGLKQTAELNRKTYEQNYSLQLLKNKGQTTSSTIGGTAGVVSSVIRVVGTLLK